MMHRPLPKDLAFANGLSRSILRISISELLQACGEKLVHSFKLTCSDDLKERCHDFQTFDYKIFFDAALLLAIAGSTRNYLQ